jgi:4-aminobutyrate aminotransferase
MDFHGNSVHQVGHGHPRVVAAMKSALDTLPFSPRRFTNHTRSTCREARRRCAR